MSDSHRTVLIDVDTQHDFCARDGALFVPGADALADTFGALIARAIAVGAPIVGSVDSHAFDAWEFEGAPEAGPSGERPGFPAHCVKGTSGWLKLSATLAPRARFVPNVKIERDTLASLATAHAPQQLLLEKEVYSLFANPNAEAILEHVLGTPARPARFLVFGVALDYCVRAATLGLIEWLARTGRAGEVWLVRDATASVDARNGEAAALACVSAGARAVDVRQALSAIHK